MPRELNNELHELIGSNKFSQEVTEKLLQRISEGNLTRDENPYTHFCVYFAAFDPDKHNVFVGHHIENIGRPLLLTITEIPPDQNLICRTHYDIWYFVPSSKDSVKFNQELLAREFFETRWLTIQDAGTLINDPSTLKALELLEHRFEEQKR